MTEAGSSRGLDAVVFDLGGVLIDWNPRYLYRSLFEGDEAAMERFLAEVTTPSWNGEQDAGRPWRDAIDILTAAHPHHRDLNAAYHERWTEMLGGPIDGTVDVLSDLRDAGVRLAAVTNWSAETFPVARERYPFLGWFETIVVSGEERIAKPDAEIFRVVLQRTGLRAGETVFVDDAPANVAAAAALGFETILFRDPDALRAELQGLGLLPVSSRPRPDR
jgi:2-haloacid dehalogenase